MIIALIEEAVTAGARRRRCSELLNLSVRTLERWRSELRLGKDDDARHSHAPRSDRIAPSNKLAVEERADILEVVNSAPFRDLSPNQIVPRLADEGVYLASESTIYRILREEKQLKHRGHSKAPVRHESTVSRSHAATKPNEVWSWDITYLMTPVRGVFIYLYLIMDIWSRKIVGFEVYDVEAAALSARLFTATCRAEHADPHSLVLHSDNGGPMKGATMVVTLERLGMLASFSRPGVSNDNPFSESLFRTLKYRPEYPGKPFASIEAARTWVASFVRWYNTQHLHSSIRFVTPDDRHAGREAQILAARQAVYEAARTERPDRWSGPVRNWEPVAEVYLNPESTDLREENRTAA
ncbi:MAG: IS3 family transposase [Gemmatimonadaceae bacterium]